MRISRRYIFIFLFGILFSNKVFCQPPWAWIKDVHSNASEFAKDIAVDTSTGEIVMVGIFNSDLSAFFGAGFSGAIGGGYVAKYDSAGNVIWAFPIGNNQDDACNSVATDATGNIYVTGYIQNIADLKGTLAAPSTVLTSAGSKDVFLAKYNSAGQLLWAKRGGGANEDAGTGVCVNAGAVFITGYYNTNASFGAFSTFASSPNDNAFTVAYDLNGNELWLADAGASTEGFGNSIAADNANVYLIGDFRGNNLSVYNSSGVLSATLSDPVPGQFDGFMISYTSAGAFNWAASYHSAGNDFGTAIAVSASHVFISGSIENPTTFTGYSANPVVPSGAGTKEFFVARLNKTTGNTEWIKAENGSSEESGTDLCTNGSGEIYVAGFFKANLAFAGGITLSGSNLEDVFVAAYDTAGNFLWAKQAGNTGKDVAYGVALNYNGKIYVAGEYADAAAFGSVILNNDGSSNIFLGEIGCTPMSDNIIFTSQTICEGSVPSPLTGSTPSGGDVPFVYAWEESSDNFTWVAASGTNTLQNYSPPALFSDTYYRRKVYSAGTCPDSLFSTSILITVNSMPSTSVAGPDQSLCNTSFSLSASPPAFGTGDWNVLTPGAVLSSTNSSNPSATFYVIGQNIFEWIVSSGVCPDSRDTVVVTVDTIPSAAVAGADQTVCDTNSVMAANPPTIGMGTWTVFSGAGMFANLNSSASAVIDMQTGSNIFVWTVSNGVCPSNTDTVTIISQPLPSVSVAGSDFAVCDSAFTLNANTPASGTGVWNSLTAGASLSDNSIPNPNSVSFVTGQNIFEWVISNGICPDSRDTVIITIDTFPTIAVAGIDQSICGDSTGLNANSPSVGTAQWAITFGAGTFSSMTSPSASVDNIAQGNNTYIWKISNGVCPASQDTVSIAAFYSPSIANAGIDQTVCSSSTSLAASTPTEGLGNWIAVTAGPAITTPSIPNTGVSSLVTGQNILEWSVSNGPCAVQRDTVIITVDANPDIANAGTDQQVCGDSTLLAANIPIVGTGTWTVFSGSGIFSNLNSAVSSANGTTTGTNIFVWTISNGVCASTSDTVVIVSDTLPDISFAGNDSTICSTSVFLSANNPATGTGAWNILTAGTTLSSPLNPNTNASNLVTGPNSFEWTITNGVCPVSRDTVIISRDENPTIAAAGIDTNICGPNLNLYANAPSVGTGTWSLASGSAVFSNVNAASANASAIAVGTNNFVWTIANGVCPVSSDTIFVFSFDFPSAALAGTDSTICTSSLTLNANSPSTGTGTWNILTSGPAISSSTTASALASSLIVGANEFEWVISNGNCPVTRDTVAIILDALPSAANAGNDTSICGTTIILNAEVPSIGSGNWTLLSGAGTISNPPQQNSSVTGLSAGASGFVWTTSNGVCPTSSDTVSVFAYYFPDTASAGNDTVICSSTLTLSANSPVTGTGSWMILSPGPALSSSGISSPLASSLTPGAHSFEWTIANGVCPVTKDTITIFVDSLPSTPFAGNDTIVCGGNVTLNANTVATGTGNWTIFAGTGIVSNTSAPNSGAGGLSTGTNIFVWTIVNGVCPSVSDSVNILSDESPTPSFAGNDTTICSATVNLNANTPVIGTGAWTFSSGSGTISNSSSFNSSVSSLIPGTSVFTWTISNGVCPPSTDTVAITIDANPTAAVAGADQTICGDSTNLSANAPATGTGNWSVLSGSGSFQNAASPATTLNGAANGINYFVWTISNGVCISSSDTLSVFSNPLPSTAQAGNDTFICVSSMQLNANTPLNGSASWTILTSGLSLSSGSSPAAVVSNIATGQNLLEWVITSGNCPPSRDTLVLTRDELPTIANAGNDISSELTAIPLSANTPLAGTGNWVLLSGSGIFSDPQNPSSEINGMSEGITQIAWTISNGSCPTSADTLILTINGLFIPQVITPNDDGKNDAFEIRAYENVSGLNLEIFNRWGNSVYRRNNYQNDFSGISDKGEELAEDTYYYIIETREEKIFKGYLVIKRK
jgi:gliding motility-associated-like protein